MNRRATIKFLIALLLLPLITTRTYAQAKTADMDQAIDDNVGNHIQFKQIMSTLHQAVAKHNPAAIAPLVEFPIKATLHGRMVLIRTPDDFIKNYDSIITPAIATAIQNQKYEDLFVNSQGARFDNGQVWFEGICRDKDCKRVDIKIITFQSTATLPK